MIRLTVALKLNQLHLSVSEEEPIAGESMGA